MATYHRASVGPHWRGIRAHLGAERSRRGTVMLDRDVDGLLAGLHRTIRWTPPVLRIDCDPSMDGDFVLDGRGLVLKPSFFLRTPAVMHDARDAAECILIYPAPVGPDQGPGVWAAGPPAGALGNLLGRTRASVLTAIADGVTTTGALAGRLDISAAAVSQHTAVLREAGLITTRRHHGNVLHNPTETGLTLLSRPNR
ncbi:winged helix-turn-helix domain-containing protein [Nonomuraea sp. NPDC005692]|uniref:ArsR/SmtB family transcription factor n=1 Tax=Nonomuraea sp. NPDC005692 TaxID=3157168 RepID=UPI0033D890A3